VTTQQFEPQGRYQVAKSGEAINGAAFLGDYLAVSTRNEVAFWYLPRTAQEKPADAVCPVGAHGVIATNSGYFVAPLGRRGLMAVKPDRESQEVAILRGQGRELYFYKAISVQTNNSYPEILVCAARSDGVLTMSAPAGAKEAEHKPRRKCRSSTFVGLDVVDVCSLASKMSEPSICAVGSDCTLVFFRDAFLDNMPVTLRFDEMQGVAYRILRAKGHLLLLTSSGIYVLTDLATRFLAGEDFRNLTTGVRVRFLRIEAVDANVTHERWLWLVLPEKAVRIDLDIFEGTQPDARASYSPRSISPAWLLEEQEQVESSLAGTS
jgi:hypothetical protein